MPVEILPLFSGRAAYNYNIVIDSVSYRFRFWWANRHGSWYMDILESDFTPIRTGIRLIVGWPLTLRDAANDLLFDGVVLVSRIDTETREPTLQDMGNNILLTLMTDPDIPDAMGPTGMPTQSGLDRQVIVEAV